APRLAHSPFWFVSHGPPRHLPSFPTRRSSDLLLEKLPTVVDREQSRALWVEYQRKIAHDQPFTFLYFQERLEGVHERLRNVNPDARGDWVGVDRWWILPSMRRGN